MRLCDAYNKNVPAKIKGKQVNSLFELITLSMFSLRCLDCGAELSLIGFHGDMNGPAVYECDKCHCQWI